MKTAGKQAAFTLIEALIASTLSVLASAMVFTLLAANVRIWHDDMARLRLSEDSRIVRERMLHGIDGRYGLRNALRPELVFSDYEIMFKDVSAGRDIILVMEPNHPPAWLDEGGSNLLTRAGCYVDDVEITRDGNILNIDLALALNSRGRKYSQSQQIRVYLLNSGGEPDDPYYTVSLEDFSGISQIGRLMGPYTGPSGAIFIPRSLDNNVIMEIFQDVFAGAGLTEVLFAKDSAVVQIHARAFQNNAIANIELPESLQRIDVRAFNSNELRDVKLPETLQLIEIHAFLGNDIKAVTIGSGVTLGSSVFRNSDDFLDAYNAGGAGNYTYSEGAWIKTGDDI